MKKIKVIRDGRPAWRRVRRTRFVRMFKPQFAPKVESCEKLQTVRPTPKRMPRPGDQISLRAWTGKPYRSKQRVLGEAVVKKVEAFDLDAMRLWKECDREAFAHADGFCDWPEMLSWFIREHGYPFTGIVIYWMPFGGGAERCSDSGNSMMLAAYLNCFLSA